MIQGSRKKEISQLKGKIAELKAELDGSRINIQR